jgi:hypothetical protein
MFEDTYTYAAKSSMKGMVGRVSDVPFRGGAGPGLAWWVRDNGEENPNTRLVEAEVQSNVGFYIGGHWVVRGAKLCGSFGHCPAPLAIPGFNPPDQMRFWASTSENQLRSDCNKNKK